ncbi:MAG: glycosyltransferase family 1 protein [Burkholderiaceae bacterium]|nr:glycosyltransferase family 1 protein [Burkholderiaceae bacterium]
MRILIDLQGAQCDSRFRGIGRYSLSLALAMARNPGGHEVWLALSAAFPQSILDLRHAFDGLIPAERIRIFSTPLHTAEVDPANAWRARAAEKIREQFLQQLNPDVIHVPSLFEGYGDDAVTSVGAFTPGNKTAVTLHDLIPLLDQQAYLPNPVIRDYYFRKIDSLKNAGLLLAISESSRLEVINALGWPAERIINTSEGADAHFRVLDLAPERVQQLRERYGMSRKMVMYAPGGFDSRKNFDGLMRAYALLPAPLRAEHQLVIASRLSKSPHDDSRAKLHQWRLQAGLTEDELVLTDFVPDDDLVALYNMAQLFVFPSKHEGFGLPPLEAMACGAPTLGSNTSSVPEVIGWDEALFDPLSPQSMADKMAQALLDDGFRAQLKAHALLQVKKFSWDASAKSAIAALEALHASNVAAEVAADAPAPAQTASLLEAIAQIDRPPHAPDNDLALTAAAIGFNTAGETGRQLLVDVTELARHDARSGIQRVVRSLLLELLQQAPAGYTLCPIYFDGFQYRHARRFMARFLRQSAQELKTSFDEVAEINQDDIYLGLDLNPVLVSTQQAMFQHWQVLGVHVYFVVYDLLLVHRPDWAPAEASTAISNWLKSVAQVATGLICISDAVANEVRTWLTQHPPARHVGPVISSFHLGADVASSSPSQGLPENAAQILRLLNNRPSFLTVGTLEPRKGHAQMLAAFEQLWAQGVDANLVFIGKPGWMVEPLVNKLQRHAELGKRLFWLDGISDEYLEKVYAAADCLIAGSEGEGFGLPLIEAARHKLPIIARDLPVFREVAGPHAHYFSGLLAEDLVSAVVAWRALQAKGFAPDSARIPFLTWSESAQQLLPHVMPFNGARNGAR